MTDLDVKGLFSSMLETPDETLTLNRQRMLGTARNALRRRRSVRIGVASVAAVSALGMGTATASALHGPDLNVAKKLPLSLPSAAQLPALPNALPKVPSVGAPALPKPALPLPGGALPKLPTLPKSPIELKVGPQLQRAKQMLTDLTATLRDGALPLPAGLPALPDVGGIPAGGAAPVSSAQAFEYADGTFRYHAVSAGALQGFGGTVTLDVVRHHQAVPTAADLCALAKPTGESGCEVLATGDGQRARLGWRTDGTARTYYATAYYPSGTVTVELSPLGVDGIELPAPALAALTALAAFRP
jgi:hypothetical protein